jgi:hypothetical protein
VKLHLRVLAAACILLGLLAVSGAPAAQPRQVRLTVSIAGKGTVTVGSRRVTCETTTCSKTFNARAGGTLRFMAKAAPTWKFTAWSRSCHGRKPMCSVRVSGSTLVRATFVAPGAEQNPIALGTGMVVRKVWRMTVLSP